jgi:hypothetical protein
MSVSYFARIGASTASSRSNSACFASPQAMPSVNARANAAVYSGVENAW